jgi:integrase/recombinase XerD
MDFDTYLDEFSADWRLLGRSAATADNYCSCLREMIAYLGGEPTAAGEVKRWLATAPSAETARYRARAVRAFAKWASANAGPAWPWAAAVPLAATPPRPQRTVAEVDYQKAVAAARSLRDRTVVELLWATGMRVSELARVQVEDIDLVGGFVTVPRSKTGRPRVVPLTVSAVRSCRRQVGGRSEGSLLDMTPHAIQLLLRRLCAPPPHAWRRGWAVDALRRGVSEASVRAAAGWRSGAMVARYVSAVSNELAIDEFKRARQ